ncbi:hypothetical protein CHINAEXTREME_10675 [Halobiforma lacisalsi AJ5]|uniref:C2H2-type domain-containing protein n=1 Tax=Natronobacterium lacisalsi AJ5 TaxID=358396 RepID=M0L8F5_NATLA|nr:hypothetical protein [Halobiforma lacisalsi]APW98225.1 hypothetical protein CHINAEXTREME_10675 [Halobiforma lacisalsi AJ5]EMA28210.1 hypothetical protein C445_19263 [Halobiforma lacisalsi AJ5]
MTDQQRCPLCPNRYDQRTDLRVHLEVEHRKSEIVSWLLDRESQEAGKVPSREGGADESAVLERDRAATSA